MSLVKVNTNESDEIRMILSEYGEIIEISSLEDERIKYRIDNKDILNQVNNHSMIKTSEGVFEIIQLDEGDTFVDVILKKRG